MANIFQKIVVTGAKGFIGRHLVDALNRLPDLRIQGFDIESKPAILAEALIEADTVFHLAGINRPERTEEYEEGNHLLTKKMCSILDNAKATPQIVFSSSIQAELENPYGQSKRRAEEVLKEWSTRTGAGVAIYRLKNVFGKWCRPNYNSVVATFCYNTARDLPVSISDPSAKLELVYIDDVISAFLTSLDRTPLGYEEREIDPSFVLTLGDLAHQIKMFRESRLSLLLPDLSDPFLKRLYATYISYLDDHDFAYPLKIHEDARGKLAEVLKQDHFGQIFISRTQPGITRGNHFHHTKVEKFLVVEGDASIRLRRIDASDVIEYRISGKDFKVIDIPPGYTHSMENIGSNELITLFWASEIFKPKNPDTHFLDVNKGQ